MLARSMDRGEVTSDGRWVLVGDRTFVRVGGVARSWLESPWPCENLFLSIAPDGPTVYAPGDWTSLCAIDLDTWTARLIGTPGPPPPPDAHAGEDELGSPTMHALPDHLVLVRPFGPGTGELWDGNTAQPIFAGGDGEWSEAEPLTEPHTVLLSWRAHLEHDRWHIRRLDTRARRIAWTSPGLSSEPMSGPEIAALGNHILLDVGFAPWRQTVLDAGDGHVVFPLDRSLLDVTAAAADGLDLLNEDGATIHVDWRAGTVDVGEASAPMVEAAASAMRP